MTAPTGFGQDPGPRRHGRLMAHMLTMAAGEICHPMALFIHMISDDLLLHYPLPFLLFNARDI
jgi:hypothetical protein